MRYTSILPLTTILLTLMLPAVSFAAGTLVKFHEAAGITSYLESSAVRHSRPFANAWVIEKTRIDERLVSEYQIEFNCDLLLYRQLSSRSFVGDKAIDGDAVFKSWSEVPPPGTVIYVLAGKVCGTAAAAAKKKSKPAAMPGAGH